MAQREEEEVSLWKDRVARRQQLYYNCLGDRMYDSYRRRIPSICNLLLTGPCICHDDDGLCDNNSEINALKKKIAFAVFGEPSELKKEKGFTGYSKKKLRVVESIYNQILDKQKGDKILMSVIFVSLKITCQDGDQVDFPVFRVPKLEGKIGSGGNDLFVDFQGRVYQSWDSFLSNNKLPKAFWCYPKDGMYSINSEGQVDLSFGFTPASKLGNRVLNTMDTTASVLSIGASAGAFFPPVAIPCAVACGTIAVYSAVRGSCELADRGKHQQSLKDREAFVQWLSLAGSVLGLGSSGGTAAVKVMAKEGKVVSDLVCNIITGINGSSIFVNGVSIAESGLSIKEAEEWNALQCFQFVASVLFFAHSAINFKTARALVDEHQIQDIHSTSNASLKSNFDQKTGIRELNFISNKADFLSLISPRQTRALTINTAHEPQIFKDIKNVLNNLGFFDFYLVMDMLDRICSRWEYGGYFMRAVKIVMDLLNCRDLKEASRILNELIELGTEFCSTRDTSNNVDSVEGLSDIEFIPSCITRLFRSKPEEEVYHFPEDHRGWGKNGELEADEYLIIGQNAFGLANISSGKIDHKDGIATVYFENIGFVKITSLVEEQTIVISMFRNIETDVV